MAIPKSALDQELEFEGRKVTFMQFSFLKKLSHVPGKGYFHSLWGGHWAKVLSHDHIFLNVSGFGGAYKYIYLEDVQAHGMTMKIYTHIVMGSTTQWESSSTLEIQQLWSITTFMLMMSCQ
jgi:hypothetical protein